MPASNQSTKNVYSNVKRKKKLNMCILITNLQLSNLRWNTESRIIMLTEKKNNTDWVAWTVGNSVQTEAVRLFSSIFPTRISITLFPLPLVLLCLFPAVSVEIVSWILLLLSYLCLFFNLQKASVETEKKNTTELIIRLSYCLK